MQLPLQITFHGLPHSDALEVQIRDKVAKLEEFHPAMTSCRVVVEEQRRHQQQGRLFNVRIHMRVPKHEFAVNRDHEDDVYLAVREAFDAAKRLLEDDIRLARGDVKIHDVPLYGHIARLELDKGHGYIETPEGDEVYFSRENVASPPFEHLEVGAEVSFLVEAGNNTLLARCVTSSRRRSGG